MHIFCKWKTVDSVPMTWKYQSGKYNVAYILQKCYGCGRVKARVIHQIPSPLRPPTTSVEYHIEVLNPESKKYLNV